MVIITMLQKIDLSLVHMMVDRHNSLSMVFGMALYLMQILSSSYIFHSLPSTLHLIIKKSQLSAIYHLYRVELIYTRALMKCFTIVIYHLDITVLILQLI